jgi:hypothetical protein
MTKETKMALVWMVGFPVMGFLGYAFDSKVWAPAWPTLTIGISAGIGAQAFAAFAIRRGWIIAIIGLAAAGRASAIGLFGLVVVGLVVGGIILFAAIRIWSKMIDLELREEQRQEQQDRAEAETPIAKAGTAPRSSVSSPAGQLAAIPAPWTFRPIPGLLLSVPAGGTVQWSSNLVDWIRAEDAVPGPVGFWRVENVKPKRPEGA